MTNEPLDIAQSLARHSTITLTMDRYTHLEMDDLVEAVRRLDGWGMSSEQLQRIIARDSCVLGDAEARFDSPVGKLRQVAKEKLCTRQEI